VKLLFITEYFPTCPEADIRGGVEARCFYIAKELSKKHDITVIASREPKTPEEQMIFGVKVIRCGHPKEYTQSGSFIKRISFAREAERVGAELDINLVEGTNFVTYSAAWKISQAKKIPCAAWYNDVWIGNWTKHLGIISGLAGEITERSALARNWNAIIANSNTTRDKLVQHGINKNKITVIPCGFDPSICSATDKQERTDVSILCVSRLVSYKNINLLIEAVSTISPNIPTLKCKIIGTGPERANLEKLAAEMGISDNIEFCGFVKNHAEVIRKIKSARVLCLPSSVEGFGISLLEAMACGTPYVCSDIPALRETSMNGKGGLFFRRGDKNDLAEKLTSLLSDNQLHETFSKAGPEAAKGRDWPTISTRTEEFYNKIIS